VSASTRTGRSALLIALLAALIALTLMVGTQDVRAASYKSCSLSERDGDPPGTKPTYNLTLKRRGVSCATAKKVMYAFHKCRARSSLTCTKRVLGHWHCTGTQDRRSATTFYAHFACRYGSRRVHSSYQQNT
jgi:hypothetical protein